MEKREGIVEYIKGIEDGSIIVGRYIRLLYCNILKPIVMSEKTVEINGHRYPTDGTFYFDPKPMEGFAKFCERHVKQSKGEWNGQPLQLMLFQKAKYDALLGVKWAVGEKKGLRRFTEVFDERARKNLKSTELGAFVDYMAIMHRGEDIYIAASTLKQAKMVWEEAAKMVLKDSAMRKMTKITWSNPSVIKVLDRDSQITALSNKPENLDGLNSSIAVIDETHNLDRDIYDVIKQSQSARKDPIINNITTSGFVRDALFDDLRKYAIAVLEGTIKDEQFLAFLYEMDSPDELADEKMWIKANPAIGVVKQYDFLRNEVERTKSDPNLKQTVLTKDFNIITSAHSAYLTAEEINSGEWGRYTREEVEDPKFWDQFKNKPVIGAYDLSMTSDLTAWVTLVPDPKKRSWLIRMQVWCSHDFLESEVFKASKIKAAFKTWIDQGWIKVSSPAAVNEDGSISELGTHIINYDEVADYVKGEFSQNGYFYSKIMNDPWRGSFLRQKLAAYGWGSSVTEPVRQGFITLGEPTATLRSYLQDQRITYLGNPVMKWMLSNASMVEDRNGNLVIDKAGKKSMNKIDGVDAVINAFVEVIRNEDYYMSF